MCGWITSGLMKSSKRKQKLYIKFLKTKSFNNEKIYKEYKNIFEKILFYNGGNKLLDKRQNLGESSTSYNREQNILGQLRKTVFFY